MTQMQHQDSRPGRATLEVVIVTYGHKDMVRRCLASLLACRDEIDRMQVHVVDNCSPDGTPEMIEQEFPAVRLVRSLRNDGFAVANNKVLRQLDSDLCLVLNPDTEMRPGVLAHLVAEMESAPEIGMMGCRLVTRDGHFDHAAKRRIPTPTSALTYFTRRRTQASTYVAPDVDEHGCGDVEAVNGAFMLVRTSAVRQVGVMDEKYWMYGEDLDWCVRFRQGGWRIRYDGRVTCVHLKGGVSGRARTPRLNWHFHRGMHLFYSDHVSRASFVEDAVVATGIYSRLIYCVVRDGLIRIAAAGRHRGGTARVSQVLGSSAAAAADVEA